MSKKFLLFSIFILVTVVLFSGFMKSDGNDPVKGKQNTDPKLVNYNFTPPVEYRSPNAILKYVDSLDGDNTLAGLAARHYLTYFNGTPPPGTSAIWYQGDQASIGFPAYNGPPTGFVQSDYNSIVAGNIDNWLVFPKLNITTGDSLFFYSGSYNSTAYPDSIRVMYSSVGDSTPTAASWVELGRFRLTSYSPSLVVPWAQNGFRATLSGANGRFAIRYCVVDGGPNGANSSTIGIDYIRVIGYASYPLSAFNLQQPASGVTITSIPNSSTPVTVSWDTSATGCSYKWIYGTSLPARLMTIPSGSNSITMTLGQLDVILAGMGLNPGDSSTGQWDVWAFKGAGAPGVDSLKATNGPRAIKFKRFRPALTAFSLVTPATGVTLVGVPGSTLPYTISWTGAGAGVSYKWLYKTGTSYSDPPTLKLPVSTSYDTSLTFTSGQLDAILATLGLNPGDSIRGYWRVRGYSGIDSLNSTAPDRQITLKRALFSSKVWTGILLTSDSTYIRPVASVPSNTPPTTLYTSARNYKRSYFNVSNTGPYYIYGGAMYDNYLILYQNEFNPLSGLTNAIGGNDDTTATFMPEFNSAQTSLPRSAINNISLNPGTTYILVNTAYSTTLYTGEWKDSVYGPGIINIITTVEQIGNTVPTEYKMSQNYPNPFNPITRINFAIPKSGLVTMKLYDILGREMMILVNEVMTPGDYKVEVNGETLASGVYFYRLETKGFTDIKKMMLIK